MLSGSSSISCSISCIYLILYFFTITSSLHVLGNIASIFPLFLVLLLVFLDFCFWCMSWFLVFLSKWFQHFGKYVLIIFTVYLHSVSKIFPQFFLGSFYQLFNLLSFLLAYISYCSVAFILNTFFTVFLFVFNFLLYFIVPPYTLFLTFVCTTHSTHFNSGLCVFRRLFFLPGLLKYFLYIFEIILELIVNSVVKVTCYIYCSLHFCYRI